MQIYPGPTTNSKIIQNQRSNAILPGKAEGMGLFKTLLAKRLNIAQSAAQQPSKIPDQSIESKPELVLIGKVTKDVPTVSQLLYKTSYKKECWNILANEANSGKSFTSISPGTDIFIDPKTFEIVWGKSGQRYDPIEKFEQSELNPGQGEKKDDASNPRSAEGKGMSTLSAAARKFLGTPYSEMDCYELVVGGLKGMGIQYKGRDGLGGHLIDRAVSKGFAFNHYLNGEGIMDAAGTAPYERRIFKINDADLEAEQTMAEMIPFLQDGQILSFSTRTQGHTGIVSIKDNVWTFINSGEMDHNLAGANGSMGVGEETLRAEVRNWFRLAAQKGYGLKVSLGSIDMEKLAKFDSSRGGFTEKV